MSFCRMKQCFSMTVRLYHRKFVSRRTRRTVEVSKTPNPGLQGKLKTLQQTEDLDNEELENVIDAEDYSEFESDFMNVVQSHKQFERESKRAKEKLKLQITKSKFIENEKMPSFLTFAEKIEIKHLHAKDPSCWTPEKLSESFPALPSTIRKVIKAKWLPRSVETVKAYDQSVIENWNNYRAGKLAVDPDVVEHLKKFEDRRIIPADEDYIKEHILEPKIEFSKPQTYLFSRIADTFVEEEKSLEPKLLNEKDRKQILHSNNERANEKRNENQMDFNNKELKEKVCNKKEIVSTEDVRRGNVEENKEEESISLVEIVKRRNFMGDEEKEVANVTKNKAWGVHKNARQSFSEFIERSVEVNRDRNTPETIFMRHVYEQNLMERERGVEESKGEENSEWNERSKSVIKYEEEKTIEPVKVKQLNDNESCNPALQTYIKKWTKLNDEENNLYPMCIKIPKGRYKSGMTYRVKDCYYDCDGEFLYRVPGLRT